MAEGKAALNIWDSVGPAPHPNPRLPAGGAAWLRAPRRALPRQEPLHPRRGPEPAAPAPAARGHCCMVPAGLGCRAAETGGHSVGSAQAGNTNIPILLWGTVSQRGCPEGPCSLVEGSAGCKGVPWGVCSRGQGLGGDRAGQGRQGWRNGRGPGPELGRAAPPTPCRGYSSAPAPPLHIWLRLQGRG